jgi:hypothetical protein
MVSMAVESPFSHGIHGFKMNCTSWTSPSTLYVYWNPGKSGGSNSLVPSFSTIISEGQFGKLTPNHPGTGAIPTNQLSYTKFVKTTRNLAGRAPLRSSSDHRPSLWVHRGHRTRRWRHPKNKRAGRQVDLIKKPWGYEFNPWKCFILGYAFCFALLQYQSIH